MIAFQFKQFSISQEHAALKLGTDAMLLGCVTSFQNPKSILDVGTGTGILSLIMAQKYSCPITAIDIDENAVIDANINVKASPWRNRITVQQISLQDFAKSTTQQFDAIICNPPFFTNGIHSPEKSKATARHCVELTAETFFSSVAAISTETCCVSIILPTSEKTRYAESATNNNFYLVQETTIFPFENSENPNRTILRFTKQWAPFTSSKLAIRKDKSTYSNEYKELTKDLYLN